MPFTITSTSTPTATSACTSTRYDSLDRQLVFDHLGQHRINTLVAVVVDVDVIVSVNVIGPFFDCSSAALCLCAFAPLRSVFYQRFVPLLPPL